MAIPPGPGPRSRAATLARRWGPLALIALAYLYVVPYYPAIHSANELPRAYLVKAIADHGTFAIDDGVRRWGATADVSPSRGRSYSNKAPGTSLLTVPAYVAARELGGKEPSLGLTVWLGRLVTGIAPTLVLLALLPGFLRERGVAEATARVVVTVYALGSMAMPYSILFIAHQPSAVAVMLAWIAATRARGAWHMAGAGVLAGLAPVLDYQAALALLPLGVLVVARRWREARALRVLGAGVLGAAVPLAALLAYHDAAFGSPWRTGYDASETFAAYHRQGFLGLSEFRWQALVGSLVTPDNGLLVFAPYWLLAAPGLVRLWRAGRRAEAAAIATVAVGYLWFLASLTFWRGGWQLGPRYITVMLPLLLVPLGLELQAWWRRPLPAVVAVAACVVGVVVYAGSCAQFPHFPERFANPVIELTWRLWRDGMAAPNPLAWLGVPGPWSLAPYLAASIAAMAWALRPLVSWRRAAAGVALAAMAVAGLALVPHDPVRNEAAYQWVRSAMTQAR